LGGKTGYNVAVTCSRWEVGEWEFGLMCGVENSTRGGVNGDGCDRGAFVANGGGGGEQVRGATGVGNGIDGSGGRTGGVSKNRWNDRNYII